MYSLSILDAIMSVTRLHILRFFSPLSTCGDKHVALDVRDFRSTSDDSVSPPYMICKRDSGPKKSTDASSSFFSPSTMVDTPEPLVISIKLKMPMPMGGLVDTEGGYKKTVRWSTYMEELYSSNFSSFELMSIESSLVGKERRCSLLMRNLVLDGIESNYVVPALFSYDSSNGEKNKVEPWDRDADLYLLIIPGTFGAMMSYAP